MKLSERLDAIIAERHLLKHPFYRAWSEGRLSKDVLKSYAGQYHAQVSAFPRFVSTVHSRCPEISARKVLTENLADEEIHGTDHPELWMQFAEGLGATRDEVHAQKPLPETTAMVDDYFAIAQSSWTEGLCALYAYESQVPAVSASKVEGLTKFYGVSDQKTLAFFKVHQHYDVEHSRKVRELIDTHAEADSACAATKKAADALWSFLDGMAREAGISCEMS
jgi:pyrroloquinoline-quinone synthase